uniref:Ig-like domain-containing protein n=1 Tax=Biomphalaria glabrata TaxID=6526 RepID=A0A2C9KM44_BIOGL
IQIYGSKFVEKERAILLTCNATGQEYVPEQLDWFFNGNKIVNDDPPGRVSIKTNNSIQMKSISSTLRIRGAQMDDAGLYLCRTSLQIESFSVVVVNGAPVVGGDGKFGQLLHFSISWRATVVGGDGKFGQLLHFSISWRATVVGGDGEKSET